MEMNHSQFENHIDHFGRTNRNRRRHDNVTQYLTDMRRLLSDERCWTKKTLARDRSGNPVSPYRSGAASWCLLGALLQVVHDRTGLRYEVLKDEGKETKDFIQYVMRQSNIYDRVEAFNDNEYTQHRDVLNLLDTAIFIAGKRSSRYNHQDYLAYDEYPIAYQMPTQCNKVASWAWKG